ncbi:MAG: TIGR00266 family protein [Planctomyces sp.]|nr:TIGR00266 family protein [Planctomyces sp.]
MQYEILHRPVFSTLDIRLNAQEQVIARPDSMLSMSTGILISTTISQTGKKPGWWSGVKSVAGGQSFFTAVFTAKRDDQQLTLAPQDYGDILTLTPEGENGYFLARGSYLAHLGDCQLALKYGGMKGFMAKTGLFFLHATGAGSLFCQTRGAILEKRLEDGENFVIDNRYIVAFSDTVQYQLVKATTSAKDSLVSGEGLVNRYTGPGIVYYQTRAKPPTSFFGVLLSSAT